MVKNTKRVNWEFPVISGISGWILYNQSKELKHTPEDAIRYAVLDILMSKNVKFHINYDIENIVKEYRESKSKYFRPLQVDILTYRLNTKQIDTFIELKKYTVNYTDKHSSPNIIIDDILRLALCSKKFRKKSYLIITGNMDIIKKKLDSLSEYLYIPKWKEDKIPAAKKTKKNSLSEIKDAFPTANNLYYKAAEGEKIKSITTNLTQRSFAGGARDRSRIFTCLWQIKASSKVRI